VESAAANTEIESRMGFKEVLDEYNTMNYEIREDSEGNVFVQDLCLIPITDVAQLMAIINTGLKVRATHETKVSRTDRAVGCKGKKGQYMHVCVFICLCAYVNVFVLGGKGTR
jgi:hypothetical protein